MVSIPSLRLQLAKLSPLVFPAIEEVEVERDFELGRAGVEVVAAEPLLDCTQSVRDGLPGHAERQSRG